MKCIKIVAMFFAVSFLAVQASAQTPTQSPPPTLPATVVDVTKGLKDNSTMVSAIKAAGMEETLMGAGPFTVFAPSNAAFGKLPAGKADALLLPDAKQELNGILSYHVVKGNYDVDALSAAIDKGNGSAELNTVSGGKLKAAKENGKIIITDGAGGKATLTPADAKASNGVVYVIDAVLQPAVK